MTFNDIIAALSKEMGAEIETEGGFCAIRTSGVAENGVTILMQPLEGQGEMLTTADLGEMPPESLERLQRFDLYDVLMEAGPSKALTLFATVATEWSKLVRDYRDAPQESAAEETDFVIGQSNFFGFQV